MNDIAVINNEQLGALGQSTSQNTGLQGTVLAIGNLDGDGVARDRSLHRVGVVDVLKLGSASQAHIADGSSGVGRSVGKNDLVADGVQICGGNHNSRVGSAMVLIKTLGSIASGEEGFVTGQLRTSSFSSVTVEPLLAVQNSFQSFRLAATRAE